MSRARRFLLNALTTALVAVVLAMPALAYDTVDEARDAIYLTAELALLDMEALEVQFEADAMMMTTQQAVNDAAAQARLKVNGIAQDAVMLINQIKNEFSGELNQDANAARTQIQEGKQASWDDIELIQAAYPMAASSTTTTIPAGTTSTTSMPATTTTTRSTPTSTGGSPSTTAPAAVTTTAESDTTTTTSEMSIVPTSTDPPDDGPTGGADEPIETVVPDLPSLSSDTSTASSEDALMKGLRVFLPPAIAEFVATPFEVVGIVLRTTAQGGQLLLGPILLLMASCLLIIGVERRRNRVESG